MAQTANNTPPGNLARTAVIPAAVSLIRRHCDSERPVPELSADARQALLAHDWSGGMAELENCIQQALVLGEGGQISAGDLHLAPENIQRAQSLMLRTLRAAGGARDVAAQHLGLSVRSLRQQLAGMRARGLLVPGTSPSVTELDNE